MTQHRKHFQDLGFTVIADPSSHAVNYTVYESKSSLLNLEDAEVFARGRVKWDGCSDWKFGDNGMHIHACDRQRLVNFGLVLAACWDWTEELIEHWSP